MVDDVTGSVEVDGRRIATLITRGPADGETAGIVWLPGYKSDMASTKATALADFARGRHPMTRFDYSGHGVSDGRFEDGTIGRWLDEVEAVFRRTTCGPQVIVGSSMGGYLALLLLRRLMATAPDEAARIRALVLIAPAWDMTEELMWAQFGAVERAAIMTEGFWLRPSQYGEPYRITRALIEEGRSHLIGNAPFNPGRPVHILQGLADPDVPAAHTRKLLALLVGGPEGHAGSAPGGGQACRSWVTLQEVPNGDHRLSRPEDIVRLCEVVSAVSDPRP